MSAADIRNNQQFKIVTRYRDPQNNLPLQSWYRAVHEIILLTDEFRECDVSSFE
jgi:hypothetical protein